jgi:hypothetical protein
VPSVTALIPSIMDRTVLFFPCAVCSGHFSTAQNKAECATHRLTAASWIDWIRNSP